MWTAEESIQDPYLEYEKPTHKLLLAIGIIGVFLAIGRSIIYYVLYYNYLVLMYADEWSLAIDLLQFLTQLNTPLVLGAMMITVGGYSFLRRNGSPYGLLYVFASLVGFTFSWYALLGYAMNDLASNLSIVTSFVLAVIMAALLWPVRNRCSNRGILTLLIAILIIQYPFYVTWNYIFHALITASTALESFVYSVPGIAFSFIVYICWAYLFYRERKLIVEA